MPKAPILAIYCFLSSLQGYSAESAVRKEAELTLEEEIANLQTEISTWGEHYKCVEISPSKHLHILGENHITDADKSAKVTDAILMLLRREASVFLLVEGLNREGMNRGIAGVESLLPRVVTNTLLAEYALAGKYFLKFEKELAAAIEELEAQNDPSQLEEFLTSQVPQVRAQITKEQNHQVMDFLSLVQQWDPTYLDVPSDSDKQEFYETLVQFIPSERTEFFTTLLSRLANEKKIPITYQRALTEIVKNPSKRDELKYDDNGDLPQGSRFHSLIVKWRDFDMSQNAMDVINTQDATNFYLVVGAGHLEGITTTISGLLRGEAL